MPVIAGAGSNDTVVAAANIARAKRAGADAALMVPPYYNRPSQEGIYQHFAKLAETAELPIVLYNVPGRTVNLAPKALDHARRGKRPIWSLPRVVQKCGTLIY